jgi:mannose-6-phosphate isomerase-like protein (cupin superfamily)
MKINKSFSEFVDGLNGRSLFESMTDEEYKKFGTIKYVKKDADGLGMFRDIAKKVKTPEEFMSKSREIKDVPTKISTYFYKTFGENGTSSMEKAAKNFLDAVKKETVKESVNESILRIKGMNKQMDDYSDLMDAIDANPKYLEKFKTIITKAIKEAISGGKVTAYIIGLKQELFNTDDLIVAVLEKRKSVYDKEFMKNKLSEYGLHFSKLLIRGGLDEISEQATSMNKYIIDENLKKELDKMSVESGKEKLGFILSKSKILSESKEETVKKKSDKKGFYINIEKATVDNENFRKVLYTGEKVQLVLMSLKPDEEIGIETHSDTDQFFRVDAGAGKAIINGNEYKLNDGDCVVVPSGSKHNIINTGKEPLKLYTLYSPPHHKDGIVFKTKKEAEASKEKFDGKTTE